MLNRSKIAVLCALGALIGLAAGAAADTLELKNGDIIDGAYMGGTKKSVRFSVDGEIQTIPVGDVLALTCSGQEMPVLEPEEIAPEVHAEHVAPPASVDSAILAPAGSTLLVRIVDGIDSRQHKAGYRFATSLEADFTHNGRFIAPRGSQIYGVIVDAKQAGRLKGKTHLTLELRDIRIDDVLYPIVTGEYELAGKKSAGKRTALTALGGAVLGALIGGKGDRIEGAAIGAGAGVGVAAITKGEQIQIPSGTLIEFRLAAPFSM